MVRKEFRKRIASCWLERIIRRASFKHENQIADLENALRACQEELLVQMPLPCRNCMGQVAFYGESIVKKRREEKNHVGR